MDDAGFPRDASDSGAGGAPRSGRHSKKSTAPVANEAGLLALAQNIQSGGKGRSSRRRRRVKWTLGITGLVIVLIIGAIGGYAFYLNHLVHRITVKGLSAGASHGSENGTENILLVGSTDRCALKTQYIGYGICNDSSDSVNGINSDVVMILHLNPSDGDVSILSIPRDLFIPNARKQGANKIDAALYQGPTQLVAAIQDDFAIPIQHYVELNFDTFANVVNALGGIYMYFPEEVYDAESDLDVTIPGCHYLNGFHALQVVRARHLQYKGAGVTTNDQADWPQESQSDIARINRDHEFLRVLATAVAKKGLSNPLTDRDIIQGVAPDLVVDNALSISHMLNLVLTYHSTNVNKAPQLTLPVAISQFGSYQYDGGDYGDVEFPVAPTDGSVIQQFLGIAKSINSMTGAALPKPKNVTVSVVNATGVTDQAATTSAALHALGFHMVGVGDANPVGTEAETVVYYGTKSPAAVAAAQLVSRSISGAVILGYDPSMVLDGAQVTVDTGTDFSVAVPAASSSGSSGTTTTVPATTTTTSSGTSAEFSAPTAANEGLAPWDPRACTASQLKHVTPST
jgi:LCP family protein required for cell wall assembly